MTNEQKAEQIIQKYGFEFDTIPKAEIRELIEEEIKNYQYGSSSEYIRLLCGYLFCIGDETDIELIDKAKHISFDVGCMIDGEWLDSLKDGGKETENTRPKEEIMADFIGYYKDFEADDDEWF